MIIRKNMVDVKKKLKMAIISGASHALKFKRENPHANEDEIIQHVNRESNNIVNKLDSEE